MNRTGKTHFVVATALAFAASGAVVGCEDDDLGDDVVATDYTYEDAYLYDAYYPADVAYAGYYWADAWDYTAFYYLGYGGNGRTGGTGGTGGATGTGGVTGTAGTTGTAGSGGTGGTTANSSNTRRLGIVGAIQALARGEQVCPGQVTVTEKTAAPACDGSGADQVRNGVNISFNGCQTSDGTIDGSIDVMSNRSASEQTCSANTIITLGHTSTITNLSFTLANGAKLVIPSQTNTGTTSYTFGQAPTTTAITSNGELQIFNSAGSMLSDHTFMGDNTFTFSGNQSYSVSGTTTIQEKNGNGTATITRSGLTRSGGCCRPTGGSITVNRTGGIAPGQHDWSFGPSCGTVTRDGTTATMPECL
jgi:hypothetical protein